MSRFFLGTLFLCFVTSGCQPHNAISPSISSPSSSTDRESFTRDLPPDPENERVFAEAEKLHEEARTISFPQFRGKRTRQNTMEFTKNELATWLKNRRAAASAAEARYLSLEKNPNHIHDWVIAGARRTGDLWASFAEEFRHFPIPEEFEGNEELLGAYREAIDDASSLPRARARASYQKCADLASTYKVESPHAAACRAWLSKHPEPR